MIGINYISICSFDSLNFDLQPEMHLECKEKRAGTYLNFSTIARFNSKSFALLIGTPQKVLVYDIAF